MEEKKGRKEMNYNKFSANDCMFFLLNVFSVLCPLLSVGADPDHQ